MTTGGGSPMDLIGKGPTWSPLKKDIDYMYLNSVSDYIIKKERMNDSTNMINREQFY